ncbi:hypothetical protein ABZ307_42990 [Streptomyces griseorubiginosus]|uniref:hypothetical protein n=1 Tax=Streptomyces griseorubiginosus TaxID=67304 RepID=UPI0033BFAF43
MNGSAKRAAWAVGRIAGETPDGQPDHDTLSAERQVLQPALVGVVDPAREAPAVRTHRTGRPASRRHVDRAEDGGHHLDVHVVDSSEHK